jgi:DNA-binding response OmpR family regulator
MSPQPSRAFPSETLPPLVLVLSSDWDRAAWIRHHLSSDGCDVFVATTSHDAFEFLRLQAFDVLVLDFACATAEGRDFLARVRQLDRQAHRIALADRQDVVAIADALEDGSIHEVLPRDAPISRLRASVSLALAEHMTDQAHVASAASGSHH